MHAREPLGLLLAAVLSAVPLSAQPTAPQPVANFNRDAFVPPALSSQPSGFVTLGARTVFMASTPSQGNEPWVTDGTTEGTHVLFDVCPGACHSVWDLSFAGPDLAFFEVQVQLPSGIHPSYTELWRTDGTIAGTFALGNRQATPVGYLAEPGLFLFAGFSHEHGVELWATDGTREGTRQVVDLRPGELGTAPREGAAIGDLVVFSADAVGFRRDLWATDGTAAGTRRLSELYGSAANRLGSFRQLGDLVLFGAGLGNFRDLWVTDGTAEGTRMLAAGILNPTGLGGEFVVLGPRAFFLAGSRLWTSDGTAAGTRPLSPAGESVMGLVTFGGRLYFAAGPGLFHRDPWVTDGTPAGTRRLLDLCPGDCTSRTQFLGVGGGRLLLAVETEDRGYQILGSDGTAAGTGVLRSLCPGGGCNFGFHPTVTAGATWFGYGDGFVVASDGTPSGTALVGFPADLTSLGAIGSRALIPRREGDWSLEISDGTVAGTRLLTDFNRPLDGSSLPTALVELGGEVLLQANLDPASGHVLAASRGTPASTRTVASFPEVLRSEGRSRRAEDRVFFRVAGSPLAELWVTDGTAAGTVPFGEAPLASGAPAWSSLGRDLLGFGTGGLLRISGPPYQAVPLVVADPVETEARPADYFLEFGESLLFPAEIGFDHGFWRTDGTPAGTERVDEAPGIDPTSITGWTQSGGEAYLLKRSFGLWAIDGVQGDARQVCPAVWPFGTPAAHLHALPGRVVFSVPPPSASSDGVSGLWTSDGIAGCTRTVPGVTVDDRGELPGVAAVFGDRLFFASDDGLRGSELWVGDGTAEGTRLFADLNPGAGESRPHRLQVIGDRLFFTATDGAHGYELWSTDGTEAGTLRHGDVAPGPASSHPSDLTAAGDSLLFTADDDGHGRELWSLALSLPDCQDPETLCLGGDRFRIRVRWLDPRTGQVGVGTALPFTGSDRTGLFWFFDAANVELLVKVLDGGPVNGFHWVFYGSLTDVEYWLTVTDVEAGTTRTYRNPPHEICGLGDTTAFPAGSESDAGTPALAPPPVPVALVAEAAGSPAAAPATTGGCAAGAEHLCLLGGRFQVSVEWRDHRSGDTGVGGAIPGTDKSGFFWFFHPSNVELVVKGLDGRTVNGHFWIFYGGLSDVAYTIRVLDTETGEETSYVNPPGEICGGADTGAF